MAKSKPDKRNQKRKKSKTNETSDISPEMAQPLLEQATAYLQTGQPEEALPVAKKALKCLSSPEVQPITQTPVLELLGEVYMELGQSDEARKMFLEAAALDPEGDLPEEAGGGAEKFMWLAQLSEEGGADSIKWFEKGFAVLRREIATTDGNLDEEAAIIQEERTTKLANALCGAAEVYMTDLSWDEDAEQRCENYVAEACFVAPDSPEPLQTLASVRLSQNKQHDAQSALQRSMEMWTGLPPEHGGIPEFPTRISLARLLMEAELEEKAIEVLERLVAEDDSSVEAWYLGGWCLHLLAQKQNNMENSANGEDEQAIMLKNSRRWLKQSLKLYALLDYEDERLRDHAEEIIRGVDAKLGSAPDAEEEEEDEEWEDAEDDEANDIDEMDET